MDIIKDLLNRRQKQVEITLSEPIEPPSQPIRKVKRRVKRVRRTKAKIKTTRTKSVVKIKPPRISTVAPEKEIEIPKIQVSSVEKLQKILEQSDLSTSPKQESNVIKPAQKSRFHLSFPSFRRINKSSEQKLRSPIPHKTKKESFVTKIPTEHITEAIVADVMSRDVSSLEPNDTISYAIRLFSDRKISGAPVVKGTNLVGMLVESDIIKLIGSKELLLGQGKGLKSLGEIKVEGVMHRNPITVREYTKLSEVADLMNKYGITQIPVLDERRELTGVLSRSDIMRAVSKKLLFKLLQKHEVQEVMKVDTDIDEILQIVERRGSIGMDEIQKRLTIPEDKIEEWGKILERHNLIEMFYPPIGKPEFRKKIS